jgi:serine/threonine-protein kinase RsbW
MERRNFNPYSCNLTANGPESVHAAVELVQRFCGEHGLAPALRAKLSIVVEEAVTNLYDHGSIAADFAGWVTLDMPGGPVRIVLADNGAPFDPREAEELDLPNVERGGGVGLAMIRAWADILAYRQQDGFNLLELRLRA